MDIIEKLFVVIAIALLLRIGARGFFWKDKDGNKLRFFEFLSRWKGGVTDITPLQQTKITLWSMLPIFAGLIWGIVVTFMAETYWLTLILSGSLPITSVQFIGNLQKYRAQKAAAKAVEEAMKSKKKR